jgi:hypothetical protein
MRTRGGLGLAFGTLILLAACGLPGETKTDVYAAIATRSGGDGLGALLEGRLVVSDGCLWVETPDGARYMPIWPRGTSVHGVPDGPDIVVVYKAQELIVGPDVALGGGKPHGRPRTSTASS